MVTGGLSFIRFGPDSLRSEIFDIDWNVAAELSVEIARHAQDASESE
jgi:hypothetical protein